MNRQDAGNAKTELREQSQFAAMKLRERTQFAQGCPGSSVGEAPGGTGFVPGGSSPRARRRQPPRSHPSEVVFARTKPNHSDETRERSQFDYGRKDCAYGDRELTLPARQEWGVFARTKPISSPRVSRERTQFAQGCPGSSVGEAPGGTGFVPGGSSPRARRRQPPRSHPSEVVFARTKPNHSDETRERSQFDYGRKDCAYGDRELTLPARQEWGVFARTNPISSQRICANEPNSGRAVGNQARIRTASRRCRRRPGPDSHSGGKDRCPM